MTKLHISVAAEPIAHLGPLAITNSLFTTLFVSLILLIVAFWVSRSKKIPTVIFMLTEAFYNFISSVLGKHTDRLFPILFTFFLLIMLGNWIGLLPVVGPITVHHVPLFRGPNADLSTTLAFALTSVGITQYFGISELGFKAYLSKFINFSNPMKFALGILEVVQEFSKIVSFSFRLFGNIFAGEVLLAVIVFLVPVLLPVPFLALEVFVGFVQALVFTVLTSIFIVVATQEAH